MSDTAFENEAHTLLTGLFELIDAALGDLLEVDFQGGILEIALPGGGGTYVINRHSANREIWVSSPKSGAWHFRRDPGGGWKSTRGGAAAPNLARLLADELASATNRPFSLED